MKKKMMHYRQFKTAKNTILAKMKISILALASVQSLEMQIKDGSFVKVNGKLIIHRTSPPKPKSN